jgi:hypothetical protein
VPPGPADRYGVHCLPSGPGVPPSALPLAQTLNGSNAVRCYRVALQASSAHEFNSFWQLQNQSPVQFRKTRTQTQGDGVFGQQSLALQASARGVVGRRAQPNPALKGRSNGVPPGPEPRYAVHFLFSGPGVPPSASPLARTLGSTFWHRGLQASQYKCSFRQPLHQYRSWRLTVVFTKIVATPNTCPASSAALTSFGVRGWRHRPAQDSQAQPLFMLWVRFFCQRPNTLHQFPGKSHGVG